MIDIKKVREALIDYENNANIVYEAIDELECLQKKEVLLNLYRAVAGVNLSRTIMPEVWNKIETIENELKMI